MRRSKIWCLIISAIIVVAIQIAIRDIIDYPTGGIIYFSLAYFAGIVLTTTAIEEMIHKKNMRSWLITAATGICMTTTIITFILSLFGTLMDSYKIIVTVVFGVSFIGFIVFDIMLIREEKKAPVNCFEE
ncbi:MAG: hypothetical protein J6A04_00360 [Clostridia bacterium]|nr:hypothetical protein [Clostridia bacterium]